jgi:hypothetical protein
MEELIRQAFLHIESHYSRVGHGCYDLLGPNKEFIPPGEWVTTIEPGMLCLCTYGQKIFISI